MKKSLATAALAAVVATGISAGAANAATAKMKTPPMKHEATMHVATTTGQIIRLSSKHHWLVVNHHSYRFGSKLASMKLKRGETVKVTYTTDKGHRWATGIEVL